MSKTHPLKLASSIPQLQSKVWRLENLYFIKTKDRFLEPLKLNRAQKDFITRRLDKSFILKARQLGFSTLGLIDLLDDTVFHENTNSAIIAHEKQKVVKLFEIVKMAFENMPDYLKPRVSLENRNELYFPDTNSKIYVTMDTRGETVHNLHVSELAFIRDADVRLAATLESVPSGGKITYETTANGMANYAYDTWNEENSEFGKFFYPWFWDPDYRVKTSKTLEELQEEYRPLALRYGTILDIADRFALDEAQMAFYISKVKRHKELVLQEYPTTDLEAFIASGKGVFSVQDLNKHPALMPVDRRWQDCMIWEKPLKGFYYTVGVDTSEGGGGDNAVITVLNANTGFQAAEFAAPNIPPDVLATICLEMARWYNNAFIVPEMNNTGLSFVDHIKMKYYNIYRREVFDKRTKETTQAIGWRTTGTTKPVLVNSLEEAVREEYIHVNGADTLKELRTFVRTDSVGKQGYGGEGSNHDDRVIALGLAYQGIKFMPKLKAPENPAQKKLREFIERKGLEKHFSVEEASSMIARRRANYKIRK